MINNEHISLYIFNKKLDHHNLELIFDKDIKEKMINFEKKYTVNTILPIDKYYLPSTLLIYDYLNYPDEVIIIKDSKISGKKKILTLHDSHINKKIIDMFGNTLNISSTSDLLKMKTEFSLYKMIIEDNNEDSNYKISTTNTFLKKWYHL